MLFVDICIYLLRWMTNPCLWPLGVRRAQLLLVFHLAELLLELHIQFVLHSLIFLIRLVP